MDSNFQIQNIKFMIENMKLQIDNIEKQNNSMMMGMNDSISEQLFNLGLQIFNVGIQTITTGKNINCSNYSEKFITQIKKIKEQINSIIKDYNMQQQMMQQQMMQQQMMQQQMMQQQMMQQQMMQQQMEAQMMQQQMMQQQMMQQQLLAEQEAQNMNILNNMDTLNIIKKTFIFRKTNGSKTTIKQNIEATVEHLLNKYINQFYPMSNKKLRFLNNGKIIKNNEQRKIKDYFNGDDNIIILVIED